MWVAPVATYTRLVIALLAGFSFLAIVPGLRFYGHYWIQLLPAAALATAVAFHAARELLGRRLGSSTTALLLAGAYAGAAAANVWAERAYYFHPDPTRILREVYDMNPFPEAKVVGEFVKSHTAERDRIVVLGSEPEIYFYADRRAATRHHYLAFLMGDRTMLPRSTALQQELISDVSAALPKYVIFVGDPISWLAH